MPQLTVLHEDTKEWTTDFDGNLSEVHIDGQKLNDIHDLARKIDKMIKSIKVLAFVTVAIVGGIGFWLATNNAQIAQTMNTTEDLSKSVQQLGPTISGLQMRLHLRELGWEWKQGSWQQTANMPLNPSEIAD